MTKKQPETETEVVELDRSETVGDLTLAEAREIKALTEDIATKAQQWADSKL